MRVLALLQLFGTVTQETAGGVSWSYFPTDAISRDNFYLQCRLCKGRAEWAVCPMFNACHLKMENPGIVGSLEWLVMGIGCKPVESQHLIWNLLHLLKKLSFANDCNAVFTVFCGNTNQWPRRQAADVTSSRPMTIIKAYFAIPLRES